MKGQVSAEMIVLLVVLLALVALVASYLMEGSSGLGESIAQKMNNTGQTVEKFCIVDEDCPSGKCVRGICQ